MKKMLTLVLVLAVASLANAAITLNLTADGATPAPASINVTAGQVLSLGVISNTGGAGGNYWSYLEMNLPSIGAVSNVQKTAAAGNIASITDYSSGSLLDIELAANDSAGGVVAGQHFTFSLTIAPGATVGQNFNLWITGPSDPQYTPVDNILFNVIPEPITMSLLGLGGLFIRKRK